MSKRRASAFNFFPGGLSLALVDTDVADDRLKEVSSTDSNLSSTSIHASLLSKVETTLIVL